MKQVYGIPAILSLVFPGLGQLVKEQYKRAGIIWVLIFVPWILWGLGATIFDPEISGIMLYGDAYSRSKLPALFLSSPVLLPVLLLNLLVHLWQIVDAYNCPRGFDLS